MLKKSNLNRLKQNIMKWKEEGYKVDDVKELVDFVEGHKQSSRKIIRIAFFSIASIFIAIFFVLVTIPLAFIHGNQLLPELTFPYDLLSGFPFDWFVITYDYIFSNYIIDTMKINEMNLIIDFVLYIFTIFAILIVIDYVINKKIIPRWKK